MKAITGLGKYLFAIPFLLFGMFHFMNADQMAGMAPGGKVMVYLTGAAFVAAAMSIFVGKLDKVATFLLGVMLLIFAFGVQMRGLTGAETEADKMLYTVNLLKDIALAGAAWMYSSYGAKDDALLK